MSKTGEIFNGITDAEFPNDLPAELEEHIIIIVCESDSINWSFHEGPKYNFAPIVFWQ